MRFWFAGPRMGFFRPGVSFGLSDFRRYCGASATPRQCVYVIAGDHGLSKIGISSDPDNRLRALQTGSAHPLKIALAIPVPAASTAYEIEQEAHALLSDRRASGEWFAVSSNVAIAAVYGAAERLGVDLSNDGDSGDSVDETLTFNDLLIPRSTLGLVVRIAILIIVIVHYLT